MKMIGYQAKETSACRARLTVQTNKRAARRISRRLFGKFTEHLGENVYNGIWAQILRNPGFEAEDKFHPEALARHLQRMEKHLGRRGLVERPRGVAPYWSPWGAGAVYALEGNAYNSDHCQRIRGTRHSRAAGIQQPIFLPLHRTSTYQLSLWIRARGVKKLRVTIVKASRPAAHATIEGLRQQWTKHAVELTVDATGAKIGMPLLLRIRFQGKGTVWLDQAFLFPADHIDGFDAEVVRLWRDARLPLLRFPGGNFASGYHWKEGIGSIDQRRTVPNPAWPIAEYNHVGTDEMMRLCNALGCEPLICVNAGDGTPEEAADWVEYCNRGTETKYGALRADNCHPAPYYVRYWEIGNEIYGGWQIGHCNAKEYAARYAGFVGAMKAVDPGIQFIANGDTPEWNAQVVRRNRKLVRSLSLHSLVGGATPVEADPLQTFQALMAYTHAYPDLLRRVLAPMRRSGLAPRLALTELQVFTHHPSLPTNASLTEALWTASIINAGVRSLGTVELITHSALLNHGGGMRKQCEFVWPQPVYFTHKLYSTQSGVWPLAVRFAGPCFKPPSVEGIPPCRKKVPTLDAVALATEDCNEVTLLVVNRQPTGSLRTDIVLEGFDPARQVLLRSLTGDSFMAQNTLEQPENVRLDERTIRARTGGLTYTFPPHSLTALVFKSASL